MIKLVLQHPPEAVQKILDALEDPATPIALGTRYGAGVEMDKNWPLYRRIISWGARSLARPLTSASDPMTGFFGIRKELVCFLQLGYTSYCC
jgi:dolichol-phosphate mannosyltransferase